VISGETGIKALNRRFEELKRERSSFTDHWKELSDFVQPRRGRFYLTDRNKGTKAYQKIINSAASYALKVARAGLLSGVMSPATQWFALTVDDPDLLEYQPVKTYLYEVEGQLNRVFNSSNLYNMAPVMLGELAQFATGCMYQEDDFDTVSRFYAHTIGSYAIGQNARFQVDTIFREWQMTVLQMVKEFGKDNCSKAVRDAYDNGHYDLWFDVCHCVMPNDDYKPARITLAKNKRFASIYWQPDNPEPNQYLRKSGYNRFPYYVPRWDLTGEDIYGTDCPGMTALGDIKGLQIGEKRLAQGIDKQLNPPLKGPASLRNQPISQLPGGFTLYDTDGGGEGLSPVYEVKPDLTGMANNIQRIENRINRAYYVDLFLAISNMDGVQPRNQLELTQRNQERLLQLGPVLTQLFGEFLNPLIDNTFARLVEVDQLAGGGKVLPVPPKELQGREIKPEYISTLAVAQRAAGLGNIERLANFQGGLMAAGMSDGRKFDSDEAVDRYAEQLRVPPSIVRPDDVVQSERQQAQEMQAQQMAIEQAKTGADAAKTASETRTSDGKSVLDGMSEGLAKQGAR
jgi:hypothetical protein